LNYVFVSTLTILLVVVFLYLLANKVLRWSVKLKSLIFCAIAALLISILLPRALMLVAGLPVTFGLLIIFALSAAFVIAYHEQRDEHTDKQMAAADAILLMPPPELEVQQADTRCEASADNTDNSFGVETRESWNASIAEGALYPLDKGPSENEEEKKEEKKEEIELEVNKTEVEHEVDRLSSLEDLIDWGFAKKSAGEYGAALEAFQKALIGFPADPVAPYLAVEISNILKDKGAYDESIKVLAYAKGLPAVTGNAMLAAEFVNTIAYLRIVKNQLLKHKLGYLPFGKIPQEVLCEIDAEFREWRNIS